MSMSASGSIAGAVSYGTRKGKAVAMLKPRPTIRNTPAQRRVRAAVWYAHDMWSRMGHANRVTWRSYYDMDGRYGFEAFSHILQRRWRLKSGAWNKPAGEPDFPFPGVHQWVTFDRTWLGLYPNLADVIKVWAPTAASVDEKFGHQYMAFKGDGSTKYVQHTLVASPDYTDGLFVVADVVTVDDNAFRCIASHSNGDDYVGCWILRQADDGTWSFRRATGAAAYSAAGGANRVGFAQRVGGLWDKAKVWVYVDGVAIEGAATVGAQNTAATPMLVGAFYRPDTGRVTYFNGWVDNLIVGAGVGVDVFSGRP